jgi:hypothetical protein
VCNKSTRQWTKGLVPLQFVWFNIQVTPGNGCCEAACKSIVVTNGEVYPSAYGGVHGWRRRRRSTQLCRGRGLSSGVRGVVFGLQRQVESKGVSGSETIVMKHTKAHVGKISKAREPVSHQAANV